MWFISAFGLSIEFMRSEAISNNCAHYEIVGDYGSTKFVWGVNP